MDMVFKIIIFCVAAFVIIGFAVTTGKVVIAIIESKSGKREDVAYRRGYRKGFDNGFLSGIERGKEISNLEFVTSNFTINEIRSAFGLEALYEAGCVTQLEYEDMKQKKQKGEEKNGTEHSKGCEPLRDTSYRDSSDDSGCMEDC